MLSQVCSPGNSSKMGQVKRVLCSIAIYDKKSYGFRDFGGVVVRNTMPICVPQDDLQHHQSLHLWCSDSKLVCPC
jgi:hypothetical protein